MPRNHQLTSHRQSDSSDWSQEPDPSTEELLAADKWRVRFAVFMCLLAFGTLCGVLAGALK